MFKRILHFSKITISASPLFFTLNMIFLFVIALSQLGITFSFKLATDTILESQTVGHVSYQIALPILFFFLMICIAGNTGNFEQMMITAYSHKAKQIFAKYFLHKSYQTKQDAFYDHTFYDQYTFVKNNIENTSNITVTLFNKLTLSIYRLLLAVVAISYFNPLIVVGMLLLSFVMIGVNRYVVKKRVALQETYVKDERHAKYYQELLSSRAHAKELRIFKLQDTFLNKWETSYTHYMKAKYAFEVKATWLSHLSSFLQVLITYSLTLYFLYLVQKGELQVGDFVFLNGMMFSLTGALSSILTVLTKDLAENDLYVQKYEAFTGTPTKKQLNAMHETTSQMKSDIVGP
ncbi:MAG: ABC transporter transmembrane domain-containing protein, partial [Niameybacter sp.]